MGKCIRRVEVRWPGIVHGSAGGFKGYTEGARIVGTGRRGKYLLINLSKKRSLVFHLKMSGVLTFVRKQERVRPDMHTRQSFAKQNLGGHTHIIFHFSDGSQLLFTETRKFGFVENVATDALGKYFADRNMGPEPLEAGFSPDVLIKRLRAHPGTTVKSALLNQQVIAGVGNIYADEVLCKAGIRPARRVVSLKEQELRLLFQGIQTVLQAGIRRLGTTLRFYQTIFGEAGGMAKHLKVYGRTGRRCYRCRQGKIKCVTIAGRSSHYCPLCQK